MTTPFPFVAGQVLTAAQLNDIQNLPISDKTASYTLLVGDVTKRTIMNSASATTITVDDAIFTVGDVIQVANKGAGVCTITAGAGVTINTSGSLALAQYGGGYLLCLSASTFTFFNLGGAATLDVNFLVVAGAGAGGSNAGGGGGGGGLRSSVTATGGGGTLETAVSVYKNYAYGVAVGAGGAALNLADVDGSPGGASYFGSVYSVGGGGGGARTAGAAAFRAGNGGCGAGNGGSTSGSLTGGLGTANQGYNGGNGNSSSKGGGGGGAGSVGGNASASTPGTAGTGVAVSITGGSVTYAAGGSGTGGATGSANTGNGGGGGLSGGNGGSGIVILSFPTAGNTITVSAGLTSSSTTSGANTIVSITAGFGTVSWA
jgi:hypothetical protein